MKLTRLLLAVSAAVVTAAVGCSGTDVVIPPGGDAPDGSRDAATTDGGGGSDAVASGDSGASNDGSSQGDGEAEGGKACNVITPNDCGAGAYCDSPTCAMGTCKPLPTAEKEAASPVCGCDDVTYWNESIAHGHGISVKANAACAPGKTCGGIANLKCPKDTFCNYEGGSITACAISDASGKCWGVPSSCPVGGGAKFRLCGAACNGRCQQIKAESTFYSDVTCP